MDIDDKKTNPVFEKLKKKYNSLKAKEEEEKQRIYEANLVERFEGFVKYFEANLYNGVLYNQTFPMKATPITMKYCIEPGLQEFMYVEFLKGKYPYSSVTVDDRGPNERVITFVLLDEDRDIFLAKYNIKVEERSVPEYYFVKLQ
jgi:hypothetical protein